MQFATAAASSLSFRALWMLLVYCSGHIYQPMEIQTSELPRTVEPSHRPEVTTPEAVEECKATICPDKILTLADVVFPVPLRLEGGEFEEFDGAELDTSTSRSRSVLGASHSNHSDPYVAIAFQQATYNCKQSDGGNSVEALTW